MQAFDYKIEVNTLKDCSVNLKDVYGYLGFANSTPDETTIQQVAEISADLEKRVSPKMVHGIFPIKIENSVLLEGTTLSLEGNDVKKLLAESTQCVLLAVTLGQEVDRLIRETQIKDMARAVILDACANSLVEEYCNEFEEEIRQTIGDQHFTDRFSPGYGDLPLSVQPLFCKILQTDKKIGLMVSNTYLMTPKKSISAVIGIADTPQPMRIKGCAYCNLIKDCNYRKNGSRCSAS